MARGLSYRDAVKILGGNGRTVAALDRILGGLLLGASTGMSDVLGLFDAKSEFVRHSQDLVRELADRKHKLNRFERTERLHAAHGVIVLSAYFEVLAKSKLPFTLRDAHLSRADQLRLARTQYTSGESLTNVVQNILESPLPTPSIHSPNERLADELHEYYKNFGKELTRFLSYLSIWDTLDARQQGQLVHLSSN